MSSERCHRAQLTNRTFLRGDISPGDFHALVCYRQQALEYQRQNLALRAQFVVLKTHLIL